MPDALVMKRTDLLHRGLVKQMSLFFDAFLLWPLDVGFTSDDEATFHIASDEERDALQADEEYLRENRVALLGGFPRFPFDFVSSDGSRFSDMVPEPDFVLGAEPPEIAQELAGLSLPEDVRTLRSVALAAQREGLDASVLDTSRHRVFPPAGTRNPILEVVLSAFPYVDPDTPWEPLLEFRRDDQATASRLRFKLWIRRLGKEDRPPGEIQDEVRALIADHEEHMRLHRLKYQTGPLSSLVVASGDLIDALQAKQVGAAARAVFALFQRREAALLEAERSSPGRDICYLVNLQERLSRRV